MTGQLPPPGWYPDPGGQSGQLWFDGRQWTDHRKADAQPLGTSASPLPPHSGQSPVGYRSAKVARETWVGLTVVLGVVGVFVTLVIAYLLVHYLQDPMRNPSYSQGHKIGSTYSRDDQELGYSPYSWCVRMTRLAKASSDESWVDATKFEKGCRAATDELSPGGSSTSGAIS